MVNTNTQSNKKRLIVTLIILIFILIIGLCFFYSKQNITNEIIFDLENYEKVEQTESEYNLFKKIDAISGKIKSKEKIETINITIKSGEYEILKKELQNKKNWFINDFALIPGSNEICLDVILISKEKLTKCIIVNNYENKNIGILDVKDDDGDLLKNYEEQLFKTNKNKKDSDEDSLDDYTEIYKTFTNPNISDTDNNGEIDGDEDFDKDGLNNCAEILYGTSPMLEDTDNDGISDNDEINIHQTSPTLEDTDSDTITDYEEIFIFSLNPKQKEENINIIKTSDDNVASAEIYNMDINLYNSFKVYKSNNVLLNENTKGLILDAYEFEIDTKSIDAKISFDISHLQLSADSQPTIYYFNEETQMLEELKTTINNGKAEAKVSHFSTYILVDKKIHEAIWGKNINEIIKDSHQNLDIVFVIDISMSMDENDPADYRKQIMSNFVMSMKKDDKVGLVLFKKNAQVLSENLSSDINVKRKLITDIFNISNDDGNNENSGTNGSDGLYKAIKLFDKTSSNNKYIIFLTDGEDTVESYSYDMIADIAKDNNIKILTIGLGNSIDEKTLQKIADKTGGKYYRTKQAEELYESYTGITAETNQYRMDSNNDGISDYFTKLICEGKLTTSTGSNPFEGKSYEEIQKNKDYDKDGLKNGEEVEIIVLNDKIYLKYLSSPIKKDTDEDGINDDIDASPLKAFNSSFMVVDDLTYIPATPLEDNLEEESNKVYNTAKIDCGSSLERAKFQANVFGNMPAAKALRHFLDNTGNTLNFNNDWGLLETYRGKEYLARNTNELMEVVEESVKKNTTSTFASKKEFTGTNFSQHIDDLRDIGWWYAVGHTRATMVAQATNNNDQYEMILYYRIVDFYDWNKDAGIISGFGGLVNDAEMYELHTSGIAKQYRIEITYKMKVTWRKGERYVLNNLKLWEISPHMSVERIK